MDYRKILLAYLRTVLICEGITYAKARDRAREHGETPCDGLTEAERDELDRLDDEARGS